jgi:nicotinamide-nucleotide amidase
LPCTVEILSIGNELLLGNTINTNASWIAAQVTSLGGKITRITTVADNLKEIVGATRDAVSRKPTFLVTTGGIGPTFDDMTLKGVAAAFRLRLLLDNDALAMIRAHYARRFPGQTMQLTKPRVKMAMIPKGGVPLRNPVGTAPGVRLTSKRIEVFVLPGVPKEAKAIFKNSVAKAVKSKAAGTVFLEKWILVQGIMESALAPLIDNVMERWPRVYIKSHPRGVEAGKPFIELHFSTSSSNAQRAEREMQRAVSNLSKALESSHAKFLDRS